MQLSPRCKLIIDGQAKDPVAVVFRLLLRMVAAVYAVVIAGRNWLYDCSWLKSEKLAVPVICVGNITVGGTGKTPMVIWLCRFLQGLGLKVAVLSRGYKATESQGSDKVELLRSALAGVDVVVDSDRVRGGRRAIEQFGAEVLVLDDGFQHRRLRRDLDIVLIDCTCPFGYNRILPAGLLRESVRQLKRAGAVVLTRCDLIAESELQNLREKVDLLMVRPVVAMSQHVPVGLFNAAGEKIGLDQLKGTKVYAFCGIGNPDSFADTLKKNGVQSLEMVAFDDHYEYSDADIERLQHACEKSRADWLVTTEKDWVKLKNLDGIDLVQNLIWLKIETVLADGQDLLCERISRLWPSR